MALTKDKKKKGKSKSSGLSVRTFGGLNKSNYTKKGNFGDFVKMDVGDTVLVQFVANIDDDQWWKEIEQHVFKEKGKWQYVPCLGDNCPLCQDDDPEVAKTSYRFFTVVYDFAEKRLAILEGPKDLSGRIAFRYEKKRKSFLSRTWDVSKLKTTPVSYDVESADKKAKEIDEEKLATFDLDKMLHAKAVRYFGEDLDAAKKGSKKSALDDDDDEDAIDDEYDQDDLEEMSMKELKRVAKALGIKTVDKEGEARSKKTLIKLVLKKQ